MAHLNKISGFTLSEKTPQAVMEEWSVLAKKETAKWPEFPKCSHLGSGLAKQFSQLPWMITLKHGV